MAELRLSLPANEELALLEREDRVAAFREWLLSAPPLIQVAFRRLRMDPFEIAKGRQRSNFEISMDLMQTYVAKAVELALSPGFREDLARGMALARTLFPDEVALDLDVLVGTGGSNATSGPWRGSAAVHVWAESWLPPSADHDDLRIHEPLRRLVPYVIHEVVHAGRWLLPPWKERVARATNAMSSPWRYSDEALGYSFREHLYEEGLATLLSQRLSGRSLADCLSLPDEAVRWLESRWREVVDHRQRVMGWDFDGPAAQGWLRDASWFDKRRLNVVDWRIETPPPKWGYFVGVKWAQERTTGDVVVDVASTPEARPARKPGT